MDDEIDIREIVKLSLDIDPAFETRSCSSGSEALAVSADWSPDVIVLDVMMPAMDGPTTLSHLRSNNKTSKIPVVFMTARVQSNEIAFFRSLGAVGVISKPFDPMTLAASILTCLKPIEDRLGALRAGFLIRVDRDCSALVECRSIIEDGEIAQRTWGRIGGIAHGLAGAAGIFGFNEIGEAAAVLDEHIKLQASGLPQEIVQALDVLIVCLGTPLHNTDENNADSDHRSSALLRI